MSNHSVDTQGESTAPARLAPLTRLALLGVAAFTLTGTVLTQSTPTPVPPTTQAPEDAPPGFFVEAEPASTDHPTTEFLVVGGLWTSQGPGPTQNGQVDGATIQNGEVIGAIHTVVAHPTDANTLWIGAVNGGIWRTRDATAATPFWEPLTDFQPGLSMGALELDPTDGSNQTLVAGIGSYSSFGGVSGRRTGLLRSTDGGDTWTPVGASLAGRNISGVGPRGDTILVTANGASTGAGVYVGSVSTDVFNFISGTSGLPFGAATDLVGDPDSPGRFYVGILPTVNGATGAITTNGGVFRTDDFGANWTDVTGNAGVAINAAPVANAAGTFSGTNNIEIAVHDNQGAGTNAVYVGVIFRGQVNGMFRSDDGVDGADNDSDGMTDEADETNFVAMDIPQTNEGGAVIGLQPRVKPGSQGAIHFAILADPNDPNTVYVGGDRQPANAGPDMMPGTADDTWPNSIGASDFTGRLFRGDASVAPTGAAPSPQWEHMTHSQIGQGGTASGSAPHADAREMVFDANGDIIETDDGGIYRRTSPATNAGDWFSVNGNLRVTELHDVAYDTISNIVFGGAQDTGTPEQIASGFPTFDSVNTGDGGDVAVDTLTFAGAGQSVRYTSSQRSGGFQRRVIDANNAPVGGGVTLIPAGFFPNAWVPQFVTPTSVSSVAPPAGQSARLVMGGATNLAAMPPITAGAVFEATNAALAPNAGAVNWTQVPTGPGFGTVSTLLNGGMSQGVPNPDVLWAGSGNQVFLRSTPGGTLNPTAALPAGAGTVQSLISDPDNWRRTFAIDTNQVFQTTNGGASWTDITGNIGASGAANFRALEYLPGVFEDTLVVGTDSGVLAMRFLVDDATGEVTADSGCWFELGGRLPNALVWDLDYDPVDDVLVAGTMGRGAWSLSDVSLLGIPVASVPGRVFFPAVCVGDLEVRPLEVCNTGTQALRITGITATEFGLPSTQFMVTEPLSGFPIDIAPGSCFPFQVLFEPDSAGTQFGLLTIESDDPCQPELDVQVSGQGLQAEIDTLIADSGAFGDVCPGDFRDLNLTLHNSGDCTLDITAITSTSAEFESAGVVAFPVSVAAGTSLIVPIRFAPLLGPGPRSATLTIFSDAPGNTQVNVLVSGNTPPLDIDFIGESFDFGDTLIGMLETREFEILNSGGCPLWIDSIVPAGGSSPDITLGDAFVFPFLVNPGETVSFWAEYAPSDFGPDATTFVVAFSSASMRLGSEMLEFVGDSPAPDIRVSGGTDFGVVCPGELAELEIDICNVGFNHLNVTDVSLDGMCMDFELINSPFRAPVSHDFCLPLTIRYTPTGANEPRNMMLSMQSGPGGIQPIAGGSTTILNIMDDEHACTLTITTDDPDMPVIELEVTGTTPPAMIDIPDAITFPPTVIAATDPACAVSVPYPITNHGICPVTITEIELFQDVNDYRFIDLPPLPITILPGETASDLFRLEFKPERILHQIPAMVRVTYIDHHPLIGDTNTLETPVCGEGVSTGLRVLVLDGGAPVPQVDQISLYYVLNPDQKDEQFISYEQHVGNPLQTVAPDGPCVGFEFHREWGGETNPYLTRQEVALPPGRYKVEARLYTSPPRVAKGFFEVTDTCTFLPTAFVDFDPPAGSASYGEF